MAKFNCCSFWAGKKNNYKRGEVEPTDHPELKNAKTLRINLHHPKEPFEMDKMKSITFGVAVPFFVEKNSKLNVKVSSHESPVEDAAEVAYEGEDEQEENSMKRDFSDFDLQAQVNYVEEFDSGNILDEIVGQDVERSVERSAEVIQSGHLSDPGVGKTQLWGSPKLKRSCSNLETRDMQRNIASHFPPPSKSQSFEDLQQIAHGVEKYVDPGSPGSILTHHSADRVMLKKRSSSQILPSRSRRLWWKLFLWSHRNLHKPWITKTQPPPVKVAFNQQGGYCSDTLEPKQDMGLNKIESPGSFTEDSCQNNNRSDNQNWNSFHNGVSGFWPQNQWVAFSTESSSLERVNEWMKDLQTQPQLSLDDDNIDESISPTSPQVGKSPDRAFTHLSWRPGGGPDTNLAEEIMYANNVVQSLNTSSTVAHISGIGLRAIPIISHFSSLRSVNLSGNFIVHIPPGSLPKGLHTLNLARNKINTIEGLRELTRLRILDLSYNRISRIGHGLSNCTVIKELYLTANKISDVEGLNRLLKLTVLDLSFNKITTTKCLGQLVANYYSLLALNLLGNPIQNNVSEDQLRKSVCGLLPNLVYLNKRPIKNQRAREGRSYAVAKAAVANTGWSSRRKSSKKLGQGGSSTSGHRSTASVTQKVKNKSKSQTHRHVTPRAPSFAFASSSH